MPCNNDNNCCRRMAVRVNRIFNGARRERTITRTLPIDGFTPENPILPLTYMNAGYTGDATIESIAVSAVAGSRKCRLTVDYSIPVVINYSDAGGNFGRASGRLQDRVDLILTMPTCPYTVEVETVYASRIGTITDGFAEITGCLITIVRVLVKCDLVISGTGVTYPIARLTDDNACADLF